MLSIGHGLGLAPGWEEPVSEVFLYYTTLNQFLHCIRGIKIGQI